jgi:spore coat polysaccharide biosynthesis protein SpsF
MKTVIIVQARISSTRLPGKVLMPIVGKTLLERMMERLRDSRQADEIVIATTVEPEDDPIVELANHNNYNIFRGHPTDLLDRHYKAANEWGADIVVKVPSDCPLIDPSVIDKVIIYYKRNSDRYDYVSNLHPATYPDGNDVEVFSKEILKEAWLEATKDYEREHTTPYIWENPERFRIGDVRWETGYDYSMSHRFTIDYKEDYYFIKRVYDELWHEGFPIFSLRDILSLLENQPQIYFINSKYAGVNWYRHHLDDLRTIGKDQTRLQIS